MRQRFVICFLLPCLAGVCLFAPVARAQISGVLAPGDPETIGARKDAKTAAAAKGAQPGAQPQGPEQPAAGPGSAPPKPGDAAQAEAAAPAPLPPGITRGKWNDNHWVLRYTGPAISWPKLL